MAAVKTCTKEKPRPPQAPGQWCHPDAQEVGDQQDGWPAGDIQKYRCPHCGTTWKEELPQ